MEQFDYIVVGAGSAGCVVARRLSEADPRLGILLLEAGISDTADARLAPLIRTPGTFEDLQGSAVDWQYLTEPQDNLTRPVPRVSWPRGKVLGGSSAIDSMVYVRGNRRDFDNWVDLGNVGWGYADLLPLFIKSERNLRPGISTRFHGTTGPMTVRDVPAPDPASVAFVRAAQEAGYGTTDDFNDFEQEGGRGCIRSTWTSTETGSARRRVPPRPACEPDRPDPGGSDPRAGRGRARRSACSTWTRPAATP